MNANSSRTSLIVHGLLLGYVSIGVPLLTMGYFLTSQSVWQRIALAGNGALFAVFMSLSWARLKVRLSHVLFLAFFGWLCLSTMLAADQVGGLSNTHIEAVVGCFLWSSVFVSSYYLVNTPARAKQFFAALHGLGFLVTGSVYASLLLHQIGISFGEVLVYQEEGFRVFGPLGDQVGFLIVLFVYRNLIRRNWTMVAFHLGGLVLTGTRGAFLAFAVGLFILGLVNVGKLFSRSGRIATLSALMLALSVGAIFLSPINEFARSRALNWEALTQGVMLRAGSMTLGLLIFRDNLFTGVGFYGFTDAVWHYGPGGYFNVLIENYVAATANQYIQTGTDGGIPALALLIALLVVISRNMRTAVARAHEAFKHDMVAARVWLLAIILGNQTAVWLLPASLVGYFVFLLAGIGGRLARGNQAGSRTRSDIVTGLTAGKLTRVEEPRVAWQRAPGC